MKLQERVLQETEENILGTLENNELVGIHRIVCWEHYKSGLILPGSKTFFLYSKNDITDDKELSDLLNSTFRLKEDDGWLIREDLNRDYYISGNEYRKYLNIGKKVYQLQTSQGPGPILIGTLYPTELAAQKNIHFHTSKPSKLTLDKKRDYPDTSSKAQLLLPESEGYVKLIKALSTIKEPIPESRLALIKNCSYKAA